MLINKTKILKELDQEIDNAWQSSALKKSHARDELKGYLKGYFSDVLDKICNKLLIEPREHHPNCNYLKEGKFKKSHCDCCTFDYNDPIELLYIKLQDLKK